jgi:hypothetical protein
MESRGSSAVGFYHLSGNHRATPESITTLFPLLISFPEIIELSIDRIAPVLPCLKNNINRVIKLRKEKKRLYKV